MISLLHRPAGALFLLSLMLFTFSATAQFGIPKKQTVTADGVTVEKEPENLTTLTEKDATNISALIEAAKEDPETVQLIKNLKAENAEGLDELRKLPAEEVLDGLRLSLDELMMLDYFFSDKDRALKEMEKEGLISEEHMEKYKADPALLEEDTRRGLYFQFISLAVVGGYL